MITDTAISNALGQRLAALTPALTIGWPNEDVPTGTPHPYLIFTHVPVSRTDSTLTGGGTIVRGFAQISIMSEIGLSTTASMVRSKSIVGADGNGILLPSVGAIANSIAALFPYTLRLPVTGGSITIIDPPEVQQGYPDGPHWRVPVRIPYSAS